MHRYKMKQKDTKNKWAVIAMSDEAIDPYAQIDSLPPQQFFIFRHYDNKNRAHLALELATYTKKKKKKFILAGDKTLGLKLGNLCAGVHLPEWQLWRKENLAATRLRPHWIISAACHSLPALRRAAIIGADCALLSPVFTPSHPTRHKPLGFCLFALLARQSHLPVFALGGIDKAACQRVKSLKNNLAPCLVQGFAFSSIKQ